MTQTEDLLRLRAEADAIGRRRPDVVLPDGIVTVNGFIVARNADVTVNAATDDLLQVELRGVRKGSSAVFVDAATGLALLRALDEALVECDGCRRAFVREETAKCAGSGATFCDDCHQGGACSLPSECFYPSEADL